MVNNGYKEQRLIITRGPGGCLDGTTRSIMKYFAILLGKRNEHQRGDRSSFIGVQDSNVIVPVREIYIRCKLTVYTYIMVIGLF